MCWSVYLPYGNEFQCFHKGIQAGFQAGLFVFTAVTFEKFGLAKFHGDEHMAAVIVAQMLVGIWEKRLKFCRTGFAPVSFYDILRHLCIPDAGGNRDPHRRRCGNRICFRWSRYCGGSVWRG